MLQDLIARTNLDIFSEPLQTCELAHLAEEVFSPLKGVKGLNLDYLASLFPHEEVYRRIAEVAQIGDSVVNG